MCDAGVVCPDNEYNAEWDKSYGELVKDWKKYIILPEINVCLLNLEKRSFKIWKKSCL